MSRILSRAFLVGQKLTKDQDGPRGLGLLIPFFVQSLKFMFDEDEESKVRTKKCRGRLRSHKKKIEQ